MLLNLAFISELTRRRTINYIDAAFIAFWLV